MYNRLWLICALTLDRIDDHVYYLRSLLSHLWFGERLSEAMEAAESDVNAFMAERKRRLVAEADASCRKLAKEIEEVWIPRDTKVAEEAPVGEVRRLLQECEKAMAYTLDDARVQDALQRWTEAVSCAAERRRTAGVIR